MRITLAAVRALAGLVICLASSFVFPAAPDLNQAEALLKQGRAADAYMLLEPYEFEHAGSVRFDYLFGLAALESGRPDKATLVFERVLAVDPNFAAARLDMARAYFQLGDYARAKINFEALLAQYPPIAARVTIERYLAAIKLREGGKQNVFTGYLEASLGHDTNVNNSTSQAQIFVPALVDVVFNLSPRNVKTADNYLGVGGGGEFIHVLWSRWSLYAGADARNRGNSSHTEFDFTDIAGRAGLRFDQDTDMFRVGVIGGRFYLDSKTNRNIGGINTEWRHLVDAVNQVNLFGQYAQYRFPDPELTPNNFNQLTVGGGWLRVIARGRAALFGSLFTGTEHDTDHRADGGKRLNGVRLGGQARLAENTDLFMNLGAQYGKFDRQNPAFLIDRSDKQFDLTVGVNWRVDSAWTVRPQVTYIRNIYNIVVFQYDRVDASITLRRDFR